MRALLYLIILAVLIAAFLLLRSSPKSALGSVVMPGPVIDAHLEFEDNCTDCHLPFSKENQSSLCLDCHEDVSEDIKSSQGYHGRFESANQNPCKSCHTEHIGRDADIISLDTSTFDHDLTDFELNGAHADTNILCKNCHEQDIKYRNCPADCYSCHADDDAHEGKLETDCDKCHREISWNDVDFGHDETEFPLKGKHREVSCYACHPDKTFENTPVQCVSCHLVNDIHDSAVDEKCDRCHNNDGWKVVDFDHNTETEFIIDGGHEGLICKACHVKSVYKDKPGIECIDCHRADDIHKSRNGDKCKDCHSNVSWKEVNFDHNKDTDFELTGKHSDVQCIGCHKENPRPEKMDTSCYNCHRADDTHTEQLGKECDLCHNTNGWTEKILFDHDITAFPLIGLHAVVPCGECHLSSGYKDIDIKCVSCHESDDYHEGIMETDCGRCHNPNGWRLWEFDHNTGTEFRMEGAHKNIECHDCHRRQKDKPVKLSSGCYGCHANDDIHYKKLGRQCDKCHTLESFRELKIGR